MAKNTSKTSTPSGKSKGVVKAIKDKVAYEKESYRMGREHLKQVKKDSPELYEKGWWRKK